MGSPLPLPCRATYLSKPSCPTSLSDLAPTSTDTFVLCKATSRQVKPLGQPPGQGGSASESRQSSPHCGSDPQRPRPRMGVSDLPFASCLLMSHGLWTKDPTLPGPRVPSRVPRRLVRARPRGWSRALLPRPFRHFFTPQTFGESGSRGSRPSLPVCCLRPWAIPSERISSAKLGKWVST